MVHRLPYSTTVSQGQKQTTWTLSKVYLSSWFHVSMLLELWDPQVSSGSVQWVLLESSWNEITQNSYPCVTWSSVSLTPINGLIELVAGVIIAPISGVMGPDINRYCRYCFYMWTAPTKWALSYQLFQYCMALNTRTTTKTSRQNTPRNTQDNPSTKV